MMKMIARNKTGKIWLTSPHVKADNDEAKSKVPEGEMSICRSVPYRSEEKLADVVSSQQDCILQDVVSGLSIKIYKIKNKNLVPRILRAKLQFSFISNHLAIYFYIGL